MLQVFRHLFRQYADLSSKGSIGQGCEVFIYNRLMMEWVPDVISS